LEVLLRFAFVVVVLADLKALQFGGAMLLNIPGRVATDDLVQGRPDPAQVLDRQVGRSGLRGADGERERSGCDEHEL